MRKGQKAKWRARWMTGMRMDQMESGMTFQVDDGWFRRKAEEPSGGDARDRECGRWRL